MTHAPQDPAVREAYQDLIRQTTDQYQALESAGYKFWFIDSNSDAGQQYASSPFNALRDLRANKSMGVFPTDAGFGTKEDFNPESNPMLADTGLRWPFGGPNGELKPVYANDLFRAVHDAFGHGLEGSGFRAEGEENAWQAHIRLFTGPARGAITTETRGQNSWLNYGPYGERNRTAKTEDTVFADQKTGLMPEWTWNEGIAPDEGSSVEGQRYMPAGDMATGRGVKDHREAMDLFEKGYRLYGALYDGMEDPIRLKKASEIERFDPENLWAVPSKKIAAAISVRNMPASDTDYLSAVKKGDTATAQRMVDEAAKAAGYTIGPVYHGTPTGGFNVFDKRMRGETSGVSRQAFSFTTDKKAAEGYSKRLGDEAVRLDAGLRVANDAMRMFDEDVAAQEYFSSKGYSSVDDGMLPEFDWGSIDDVPEFIKELRGYAKDLKPINKRLSDSFIEAAKVMTSTKAVPEVKRVFLRIPEGAPVFQATPQTLGQVMSGFSAENQPTKAGIVELPGNERIYYVADSSQVKLVDAITKDNSGNVIPLSQRFKATSEDIRFMPASDQDTKALQMLPKPRRSLDAAYRDGVKTRSQDPQYYDVPDYVGYDMARTAAFEMGREGAEPPRWVMAERIGKLPTEGRSKNFAEDRMERGVSVLRIVGEPQSDVGTYEMFNPGEKRYVAGWLVGLGSDGEPLLADAVDLGPASSDVRMMPSPDSAMPGAYSFPGGYRAIPGKAKGSLRLYGPAGSLIGIAASLDEAQRIIRKKSKQ
jgi:hypothetical protein